MRNQFPSDSLYAWRRLKSQIDHDEWDVDGQLIRRDGYELYIIDHGFELVRRNPETLEPEVLFSQHDFDLASPHAVGALSYILNNVETFAQEVINDGK